MAQDEQDWIPSRKQKTTMTTTMTTMEEEERLNEGKDTDLESGSEDEDHNHVVNEETSEIGTRSFEQLDKELPAATLSRQSNGARNNNCYK